MSSRRSSERSKGREVGERSSVSKGRIVVEALSKSYENVDVLHDVSFELLDGEFLTLLGPSGSGKSTTLNIIAGFVDPSGGDVRVGEKSIIGLPARHRNLGLVFQNYALFPHMTVTENVEFGLRMRDIPRQERRRRASDMLQRVGLEGLADRKPTQLSGGQQQRVALARALIIDPAALLLDEPLGALDRRLRQQVEVELKELQTRTGVSVLYVTHDQEEAMIMSDRLIVMRGGRIEQIDTAKNVYKFPATRFVANFLGEANIFEVVVDGVQRDAVSVTLGDGSRAKISLSTGQQSPATRGRASVCVRPERLRFVHKGGSGENQISGTLKSSVYLGSFTRHTVHALGVDVLVTVPDSQFEVRPEPGASVILGWEPEDGHLLLDDEGPGTGQGEQEESVAGSEQSPIGIQQAV